MFSSEKIRLTHHFLRCTKDHTWFSPWLLSISPFRLVPSLTPCLWIDQFSLINQHFLNSLPNLEDPKDFANYKDEALEIYPTIVYACTAVFWRHWLFWLFESLTLDTKTLVI